MEGDWWATPGSSPEALGFHLEAQTAGSPPIPGRDDERARASYRQAEASLAGIDAPLATGALALRQAALAFRAGALEERPVFRYPGRWDLAPSDGWSWSTW